MKKFQMIAVALAAAAATSGAFAQSSVNVYGRLNVTVERQKVEDGKANWALQDNSSRIGFKGVEDLGGGLKAGFQIEHGFNPTTGAASSTFWGRQAEVNLAGSFGMVRMGTFTSEAYFATADYVSMHNHDTGTSSDAFYVYPVANARKVSYRTPNLGGLVGELAVVESDATGFGERGLDLALNYDQGPLHIGFGYNKVDFLKQTTLAAAYTMGQFTLGGYVQRATADGEGQTNLRLSGMYTMGASELHVNFGKAGNMAGLSDTGGNQFTLGYNYNLSKRTKVYGFYTKVNGQDNSVYADFNSLAAGVRHNF